MKTRFLAMLLAVLMIAGAAMSVSAFDDVKAGDDHANAINVLAQLGVIKGYDDGTFKPDQKVTRAEMARLVYGLYTTFETAGAGTDTFEDVKADFWASGFITWCVAQEVIHGYGNGNFGPNDNVTYDAALKMVCSVLGYTDWDAKLWPTNVRIKALRELNLGEGLENVKGEAELTRAQVAQILYNALDEKMNETKIVDEKQYNYGIDGNPTGFTMVPKEVAKTLLVDVWFVEEVKDVILEAAEVDKKEGLKLKGLGPKTLEELGLVAYEGKTADLKDLSITLLKNTKKGEIIAGSAVIAGSVVDGVKVDVNNINNTGKFTVTIDGVTYTKDTKAENVPTIYDYNAGGDTKVKVVDDKGVLATDLEKQVVAGDLFRAIDKDGDGNIDYLVVAEKAAYIAGKTKANSEKVEMFNYTDLNKSAKPAIAAANVTAKLAEGDVFVGAMMNETLYVEKVAPVETYATRISADNKTVTLNGVGAVKNADQKVNGAVSADITDANLGEKSKGIFYIYNGEIIFSDDVKTVATAYDIALLKEIVENKGTGYDEFFRPIANTYTAVLIIDGKEVSLPLAKTGAIIGAETLDAQAAFLRYGIVDKDVEYIKYNYALVACYEKTKDGYVLTIDKDLDKDEEDNYTVVPKNSLITYNEKTGLYTVAGYNKVIVDANSKIFYTYKDEAANTGDYRYLGTYNKDTFTYDKGFTVSTAGETYLVKNENGTMTLIATLLADKFTKNDGETDDSYLTNGTLVLYAPKSSEIFIDGEKKYYEYMFMDNATITNNEPISVEFEDATPIEAGKLYALFGDNYIEVTSNMYGTGVNNGLKAATLTDVLFLEKSNLIEIDNDENNLIGVSADVTIWGLAEKDKTDKYVQLSLEELAAMLELVNEAGKEVKVILVNSKDGKTDVLKSIIFEYYVEVEEGKVDSVNTTIFDNFIKE